MAVSSQREIYFDCCLAALKTKVIRCLGRESRKLSNRNE